jgi:hypothetical protein
MPQTYTPARQRYWVTFTPDEAAPAFAVMELKGVTMVGDLAVVQTQKPTAVAGSTAVCGGREFFVNGPSPVDANGYGRCTMAIEAPTWCLYDDGEGSPGAGDGWGPQADSWKLVPSDDGFQVIGGATAGRVEVVRKRARVRRAELTADYWPGDANVAAEMLDQADNPEFTAYVPYYAVAAYNFGIGRVGSEVHTATHIWVAWNSRRERYEIIDGHFATFALGKADGAIALDASGTVSVWWKDYATGNMADSGVNVTALNWLFPGIDAGDRVGMAYDRQEAVWKITAWYPSLAVTDGGVTVEPVKTISFAGGDFGVVDGGNGQANISIDWP